MSQPIQPDPIQPPRPNELNDLFDTLLDENIHIDNYMIAGLNNQATQLQAQIQGDAQIIIQLQAQLDAVNNNFNLLNQAHNFQT
ncbi:20287_t:CDS:2, partial [Entrophospora sp. SA101]